MAKLSLFGPRRAPKGDLAYLKGLVRRYVIRALNTIERLRRRWVYGRRRHKHPCLVAQGDSWFFYPLSTPVDTLQHLNKTHAINVLAGGARHTSLMVSPHQLRRLQKSIEWEKPEAVLISGGGVDVLEIMNARAVRTLSTGFAFTSKDEDFLNRAYIDPVLKDVEENLVTLAQTALKAGAPHVFLVGYDYLHVWPVPGQTIRDSLDLVGAPLDQNQQIADALMDLLFATQRRAVNRVLDMTYIEVQGRTGPKSNWPDEAHAHSDGYAQIADHVRQVLAKAP